MSYYPQTSQISTMIESGDAAKLGVHALAVFSAIAATQSATVDSLVKSTGICKNQIIRSIRALENLGYIK